MNNIIECPICGKNSAMRYNEKSIYESRCLYSECREVITVTAKSEVAAKELFAKFGSIKQPKLSIPKKIADMIDQEIVADNITKFAMFHEGFERLWLSDDLTRYCLDYKNYALASAYLAGKALGVELVEVTDE